MQKINPQVDEEQNPGSVSVEQAAETADSVAGQPPQQRGWELISEERERQQTREGWNASHDDEHENGALALAADCYREIGLGSHGHNTADADQSEATEPDEWPWGPQWWKPKTRLRNLVRAGALYQAEIDRLCRVRMQVTEEIDALLATKPATASVSALSQQDTGAGSVHQLRINSFRNGN